MGTESGKEDGGQHTRRRSSWWVTTSPRPFRCRPLLSASVVVRRPLLFILRCCPSFVLVRRALLHRVVLLALRLAMGEVDGGGHAWFSWALVVVCGVLHPLHIFVAIATKNL